MQHCLSGHAAFTRRFALALFRCPARLHPRVILRDALVCRVCAMDVWARSIRKFRVAASKKAVAFCSVAEAVAACRAA